MSFLFRPRTAGGYILLTLVVAALLIAAFIAYVAHVPTDETVPRVDTSTSNEEKTSLRKKTITPLPVQPKHKAATREELYALVNQERQQASQPLLQLSEGLNASAQAKADDMIQHSYHAHINPETGMHGYEYIPLYAAGVCSRYMSENITGGAGKSSTAESANERWMRSTSHREAMLNPLYTLVGYGIATDKNGSVKIVQHLCQGL